MSENVTFPAIDQLAASGSISYKYRRHKLLSGPTTTPLIVQLQVKTFFFCFLNCPAFMLIQTCAVSLTLQEIEGGVLTNWQAQ